MSAKSAGDFQFGITEENAPKIPDFKPKISLNKSVFILDEFDDSGLKFDDSAMKDIMEKVTTAQMKAMLSELPPVATGWPTAYYNGSSYSNENDLRGWRPICQLCRRLVERCDQGFDYDRRQTFVILQCHRRREDMRFDERELYDRRITLREMIEIRGAFRSDAEKLSLEITEPRQGRPAPKTQAVKPPSLQTDEVRVIHLE